MFSNQNHKLGTTLRCLQNLMPIIFRPTLNIIELQLAFANNLEYFAWSHGLKPALGKCYWQRAHFTLDI